MIIAISGKKLSGKDTAALGLIERHKFVRISFADKLKDICSKVFNIPREDLDDPIKKEASFTRPILIGHNHIYMLLDILEDDGFFISENSYRAISHEFINKQLNSLRQLMQVVGTDIIRNYVDNEVWLKYLKKTMDKTNSDNFVIADARLRNEREFLKSLGAILILIKRNGLVSTDTHSSENDLGNESDYDVVIDNNKSIIELQSGISLWWTFKRDGTSSNY
jgi:hypothetical protein